MKAIFLNSPKHSGKDYITNEICSRHINFHHMKFADPLYKTVREMFALDEGEWWDMYQNAKEKPSVKLMGLSPRNAMIMVSEDVMKPRFGRDFYGKLAANRVDDLMKVHSDDFVIFSDCGFAKEIAPVVDMLGKDNCILFHIDREGCTFDGDSRSHVWTNEIGLDMDHYAMIDNRKHRFVGDVANEVLKSVEAVFKTHQSD